MTRIAALMLIGLVGVSCSPSGEVTGAITKCATDLYPGYNPKLMEQCVEVCRKCDRGTVTTCTTSCTLKGAH